MNCLLLITWQKLAPLFLTGFVKIFVVIVIISSLIGAFGGFGQLSFKKILAYSSINHIGWILAGIIDLKEVPVPKQAIYQYRIASIHRRLGSLYHNSYRNQMFSDSRRKQMRTLADLHYVKACTFFSALEHANEFLRALLERVGLWELHLSGLTGFGSKVKVINSILEYMVTAKPILEFLISKRESDVQKVTNDIQDQSDDDDENAEQDKMLKLFEQQLQIILKTLVKCYSSKASKYKESFRKWDGVYNACLKHSNDVPHHAHLYSILGKIDFILQNSS